MGSIFIVFSNDDAQRRSLHGDWRAFGFGRGLSGVSIAFDFYFYGALIEWAFGMHFYSMVWGKRIGG